MTMNPGATSSVTPPRPGSAQAAHPASGEDPGGDQDAGLASRPATSLSPSRAGDFTTCPLLYRFRTIDRLPEPPGREAVRGTLVHSVLEKLYDLPAEERVPEAAAALVPALWLELLDEQPELAGLLFGPDDAWHRWLDSGETVEHDPAAESDFLTECRDYVGRYFDLEDPRRLNPHQREMSMSVELASGLVLRGIIDRLDRAPDGALRVVDYKTGKAPAPGWESRALFQMRFYALMLWRETGQIPSRLQLLYIGSGERIVDDPHEGQLLATERKIQAIWRAIEQAMRNDRWDARPSKLCGWCSFKERCPAWAEEPADTGD